MGSPSKEREMQHVPVGSLTLWDRNPRRIQPDRFEALKHSLVEDPEMMNARPLIALMDGRVIAGNMRLRAAQDLGWETVPVVYVDLDEARAHTWAIRDNVPYGEWDDSSLAVMLKEIESESEDLLALTGLAKDDIKDLFAQFDEPAEIPADRGTDLQLADVSIGDPQHLVEKGEVWRLGRHVLYCSEVYDGWQAWVGALDGPDVLLVPYPTPTLPLTVRAETNRLVMVQPDPWLAGHVIDKYAAVRGEDEIAKVAP